MKSTLRAILFLFAAVLAVAISVQHSPLLGWVALFTVSALLTGQSRLGCLQVATLTTAEITADLFAAFRKMVVALKYFATDFSSVQAKFGQQIIAHVAALPAAVTHDNALGYFNAPQDGRGLITDVPLTMDVQKDVIVNFKGTDLTSDRNQKYLKAIDSAAYVLGKAMIDAVLAKALAANLSNSLVCADANATAAKLRLFAATLNALGTGPIRHGLVSSGFMTGLLGDTIVASGDYYDQRQEAGPFAVLNNIAGFQGIMEYPDFPANGENLNGLFFEDRAIVIASRLPSDSIEAAQARGIPVPMKVTPQTDPESGLTVLALERFNTSTLDLEMCWSVMFGSAVGKQGGAAGALMDKAALRIKTA